MSITAEYLKQRLDYDPLTGIFTWKTIQVHRAYDSSWNTRFAGKEAGHRRANGYWVTQLQGKWCYLHHLAWLYMTGDLPECQIDHIDHNPSNNSFVNLRAATNAENSQYKRMLRSNTSGHIGVYWDSKNNKWRPYINVNNKCKHLGRFDSLEEAIACRRAAQSKYHRSFAYYAGEE